MAGLQEAKLGAAVDRFYEAAAHPDLWRTVLHEISLATGAEGALLHKQPPPEFGAIPSEGIDEVFDAFVREGWSLRNPRQSRGLKAMRTPYDVITDSMCFSPEEWPHIPFNADLIAKHGLRFFAGMVVGQTEKGTLQLSLERRRQQGAFSRRELSVLRRAVPHLQAAGQLTLRLAEARAQGMLDALDLLNCGGVLLDPFARVVRMNAAAQHHLGRGLTVAHGQLMASHRGANVTLYRLIGSVLQPGCPHDRTAIGAVAIPRPEGGPLIVHAAPVVGAAQDVFQRANAILMIVDPDEHSEPAEPLLRQAFGLTPSEARLALGLAQGRELKAIAAQHGISEGTARSQLKAIFDKTDTHRQTELVALLGRMALLS